MTLPLTDLEQAVLAAIVKDEGHLYPPLAKLLGGARVSQRENTGHGFYTQLILPTHEAPPTTLVRFTAPHAWMNDMGPGACMGFILWCADGYPDCLEGYQNGDETGRTVDLKTRDLAELTLSGFFPD